MRCEFTLPCWRLLGIEPPSDVDGCTIGNLLSARAAKRGTASRRPCRSQRGMQYERIQEGRTLDCQRGALPAGRRSNGRRAILPEDKLAHLLQPTKSGGRRACCIECLQASPAPILWLYRAVLLARSNRYTDEQSGIY